MAASAKPTNGYDRDQLISIVDRIENLKGEIASTMGAAMRECKTHRDDIKEIYTEAKSAGIPIKALRAQVELRDLDRQKAKVIAGLDGDDEDAFDKIMEALGDYAADGVSDDLVKEAREAAN